MKAIILAAGMGSRLGRYTKDNTKAMVEVNGKKLIENLLDILNECGVYEVIIVVGYKKEKLIAFLGETYKDIKIKYIVNEKYNNTNNIYSLYLAKKEFNDDIILLESDIIFEKSLIEKLIKDKNKDLVAVDKYQRWMDGTVTILKSDNTISRFVDKTEFDWNNIDNYYKTVNIYKFSKKFLINKYLPYLEAYIKSEGYNSYYEQVLSVISSLKSVNLKAMKLESEKWYEIDDAQDLDIATVLFSDDDNKLKAYQKRYGGYWRFPKLKDFCYLVNPYFPPEKMKEEMKSSFDDLLTQYPSGRVVQEILSAKLFNCDDKHIVLGNGASELIKELIKLIEGRIGIIAPTFNEYGEKIGKDRLAVFNSGENDFDYSVEDLIEFSKGINALILINPDNPSGHILSKEEIIRILDVFEGDNKKLILDESFIDFAGEGQQFTMIDSEVLEKYTNLFVIKSISKSYGVPGIRLGVLATSNSLISERIKSELPIWNINSFGEYFLQIIGKYKSDYKESCIKIAKERDRFFNELNSISFLAVKKSYSNYFLCKIKEKYTAEELSKILLKKYNILIKDCTGKHGIKNDKYVRIAVKDKKNNELLICTLKSL